MEIHMNTLTRVEEKNTGTQNKSVFNAIDMGVLIITTKREKKCKFTHNFKITFFHSFVLSCSSRSTLNAAEYITMKFATNLKVKMLF